MPVEADDDMTIEGFHRRLEDRWQRDLHMVQREVDVVKQRTDALEIRTDRMMTESAEARAENRELLGKIFDTVRELQDHRAREEGRREAQSETSVREYQAWTWAATVQRWAFPALVSVIAALVTVANKLGWI